MKKLILSLALIISFGIAGAQTIDFESKVIDYGIIEHNSDGNREYKFTNTGTEALIIKNAKGSCGCTVPNYKKKVQMEIQYLQLLDFQKLFYKRPHLLYPHAQKDKNNK